MGVIHGGFDKCQKGFPRLARKKYYCTKVSFLPSIKKEDQTQPFNYIKGDLEKSISIAHSA